MAWPLTAATTGFGKLKIASYILLSAGKNVRRYFGPPWLARIRLTPAQKIGPSAVITTASAGDFFSRANSPVMARQNSVSSVLALPCDKVSTAILP